MLLSAAEEVLSYRSRAPPLLSTKPFMLLKLLMVALSLTLPMYSPVLGYGYGATVLVVLLLMGLRRVVLHIITSITSLYLALYASALLFHGNPSSVTWFTSFASASLPVSVFILSSTRPSALRRVQPLYVLLVVFSSVLREVVDIATVYRSKGSSGVRYWLQVAVASTSVAVVRSEALADALRARGVE